MVIRRYLDVTKTVYESENLVPHKDQLDKVQMVTFRLADSLPLEKTAQLRSEIEAFKEKHPKPWTPQVTDLYHRMVGDKSEYWLQQGFGSCIMADSEIRKIVEDAIMFFNEDRYYMHAYVIMPNHVHLLLTNFIDMESIMKSMKQYAAGIINQRLHKRGKVWMRSYFDRFVRSEATYGYYWKYIKNNPLGLRQGTYTLWMDPESTPDPEA